MPPDAPSPAADDETSMSWVSTRPGIPYFVTGSGEAWTPIGHNDAITWPELAGLFRRRDMPGVEAHLRRLKAHGVTCIRLMLEYCQQEHRYLERPAGRFAPNMVRLWDDLFALLEKVGLRVLLTPYDTFFMWRRWRRHPYHHANGGECRRRDDLLRSPEMRDAIKTRLRFATNRWGGSPALFAWDIWNEMHPAHSGGDPSSFAPFITDVAGWLREHEIERHGRAHPQTVSIFGPELLAYPDCAEPIFRHPSLDFASPHLYEHGTIDDPADTVAPALAVGRLMRAALAEVGDMRPVLDSEHGPIHSFKDRKRTLPEPFDDEYFRHMQWAHLASGGAGGGMRWPNRHPHVLTPGMRRAQRALAAFLPLIDWASFRRRNLNEELDASHPGVAAFACADRSQAIVWLLRTDALRPDGTVDVECEPAPVSFAVPDMESGDYLVTAFDTATGQVAETRHATSDGSHLGFQTTVRSDLALAIQPVLRAEP